MADGFLRNQLRPERFEIAADAAGYPGRVRLRMQPGYDHSYYFISSFMDEHIRFHATALAN